jgi:N-acyl-D-amino-acid deacylase
MYDLLILNGKIISGTGNPWFYGDVAVIKNKIVRIGRLAGEEAATVIDATGLFVSPGFIDGHSHSDLFIFVDPMAEPKTMMGVTTENIGMDGMSVAPIDRENIADWRRHLSGLDGDPKIEWTWRSFADYLAAIESLPTSNNITSYVGLGTIRSSHGRRGPRHLIRLDLSPEPVPDSQRSGRDRKSRTWV